MILGYFRMKWSGHDPISIDIHVGRFGWLSGRWLLHGLQIQNQYNMLQHQQRELQQEMERLQNEAETVETMTKDSSNPLFV